MSISDNVQHIPPYLIQVGSRQRTEAKTDGLIGSIKLYGILNPIIVRSQPSADDSSQKAVEVRLVAGHRRLACAIELGHTTVPVLFYDTLDSSEARIIELEENIKREDLPWRDHVRAIGDLHRLKLEADPSWTLTKTAEQLSYTLANISYIHTVYGALDSPTIAEATSITHAYGILQRISERRTAAIVENLLRTPSSLAPLAPTPGEIATHLLSPGAGLAPPPIVPPPYASIVNNADYPERIEAYSTPSPLIPLPQGPILVADFLTWAPVYVGPKFNLIHCDFPYGNNAADATIEHYENNPKLFRELLAALVVNLDKLLSYSAHLMFWLSFEYYEEVKASLRSAGLHVINRPLIWVRSDSRGAAPGIRGTQPRHSYEICLLAYRGNRPLTRQNCDSYVAPTVDRPIHPTQKPEPMLEYFLSMLVDSVTDFLDPTAGSGASLAAAERCGARLTVGLEINPEYAMAANANILSSRRKREANQELHRQEAAQ